MLSQELWENCQEAFGLIPLENRPERVQEIIDEVTEYLESDIDGYTDRDDLVVAEDLEPLMAEMWELIPDEEKRTNNNLVDYFDAVMDTIIGVLDRPSRAMHFDDWAEDSDESDESEDDSDDFDEDEEEE